MSTLDINQLYNTSRQKKIKRYELYDDILQIIHKKIKKCADEEDLQCLYVIPEFILGKPMYNFDTLKKYIMESLTDNGFFLECYGKNLLFISWDVKNKKKHVKKPKQKKTPDQGDYKLLDEYKPSGKFTYNPLAIESIKHKSIDLLHL